MAGKKKTSQASAVGTARKQSSRSKELLGKAIKREARRSIREAFPPAQNRRRKLETRKRLVEFYREGNDRLAGLFGRDLSQWNRA